MPFGERRRASSGVCDDDVHYLRVKKKKEFTRILKTGKRTYSETLTFVYIPSEETKMAVCVGKKYGKSVQRNRIKRLLRAAFDAQAGNITSPCAVLLIPKVREEYSYALFRRDIGKILKKERLIES